MASKPKSTELTEDGLALGLSSRHLRMLAVGGSIGVGLFLGSGAGIAVAGPALILVYAVVGAVIFIIMRALGELLIYRPVTGSFTEYAREFLGPAFGFITGWGNWITWTLIGMSEITAAGIFVQFWFPDVPQWVTALVAVVCLVLLNLLHVGAFGEAEFWFASIKIIAIVGLILGGLAVILFGIGPAGQTASFGNLVNVEVPGTLGGFAPFGIIGILFAIQIAVFSYQGAELLGMAASETRNRRVVVPKAINSVPLRIILFYVGSLVILMSVVEWNKFSGNQSPFVQALEQIGIPAAAGLMNFVVLTSALSACSSGLFSNARLLKRLATDGVAPAVFASTNRNHVPAASVLASGGVMLLGVILNAVVPEQAFQYLLALCSLAALWTWGIILVTHMVYRRKVNRGELPPSGFKLPAAKVLGPIALTFLAGVVVLMAFDDSSRVALYALPFWAAALIGGYYLSKKFNPRHSILNEVAPTPPQSREELLVKTPRS
ncbi:MULTISPECIES: amino acid permease [Paenarthrobacter]|uniref:amino acid permease n=1 Tax=Paenarthrobacter TaxID=1742992 RepID=UPI00187820A4|nr:MULTISPECIES: amino acid permease [Paenarthrobacter]MEC3854130.1 amino acid permease [Paenarthrobacter ureafaciens]QOT18455.1 amino acid permease [Paenarthrobacter sp. YJN-5]